MLKIKITVFLKNYCFPNGSGYLCTHVICCATPLIRLFECYHQMNVTCTNQCLITLRVTARVARSVIRHWLVQECDDHVS